MNTPSFTNRSGRVVMLDAVPLGKGGQAVVYRLRDDPRSVAKIFNPPLTREAWEARKKENHFDSYEAYLDNFWKKRRETEEKLKFMVAHPTPELLEFTAWPTDLLHENGKLQGYVMPFIDGARELHEFSNPSARRSKFEKQKPTWQHAVVSAINLARAFAALHECGHVVGDGKPQNVLLNANGTLRVVDCDSFQIDLGGGRILPCPVDSSEYCPPELRKADPAPRTANHDNFQLAAMLFELLYEGNKPYACIPPDGVSDEVSKPGEGNRHFYYPYDEANARATGCKPPLRPFPPDALLPDFIMRLFAQAFTERGVKKRPTAAEWRRALEELNDGIVNCEAGAHKVYQAFRSACPFCLREQKKARGASTPPPMPGASASARASSAPPPLPGASASAGASSTPPPLPGASASTGASSTPPPLPSTRGSKSAIRNFWIVVVVASLALGGFGFSEYRKLEREKETSAPTPPPQAAPTSPSESAANPPASAARERITNIIGMEFVLIPAGSFTMGDDGESADDDEKPRHRVTISQPFYLGKYEVTQMQWAVVMGNNPSRFKELSNPVENVSWNDVQEFIRRLNQMLLGARKYRLPTEAEWEYAARAGTTSAYSFGDDAGNLYRYAWYKGNSEDKTHPVGQRDPNAWGLHDMHGNVWEWVEDWYDENYYARSPASDPRGPSGGKYRVLRGGSWATKPAERLRSANRDSGLPERPDDDRGFRLAFSPDAATGNASSAPARTRQTERPPDIALQLVPTPSPQAAPTSPSESAAKIPASAAREQLAALIADSPCRSLIFNSELAAERIELMTLILRSESMDCDKKQYWYNIMPAMTSDQLEHLFNILDNERKKLEALYLASSPDNSGVSGDSGGAPQTASQTEAVSGAKFVNGLESKDRNLIQFFRSETSKDIYVLSTRTLSDRDFRTDPDGVKAYRAAIVATRIKKGVIVAQKEIAQLYSGVVNDKGYSGVIRATMTEIGGKIKIFVNEKTAAADYGQNGYVYWLDADTLQQEAPVETVFKNANWGWFPYFEKNGNLRHFSFAGYYDMQDGTRKGSLKPETAALNNQKEKLKSANDDSSDHLSKALDHFEFEKLLLRDLRESQRSPDS